MWSFDSSKSEYRLESVSLGSNEEFARLYNELCNTGYGAGRVIIIGIRRVDGLLRRAEKNAQLRKVIAGILIDQKFLPLFRTLISRELASRVRWASVNEESLGGSATTSVTRTEVALATLDPQLTSMSLHIGIIHLWEQGILLEELSAVFTSIVACGRESAYDVVVSAVVLLALVYQYLQGCVDKGGSKTYSSGSLDFRDSFVCIVLFRGAYVWIKFRQAACPASRRKRKSLETPNQASPFGSHDESPVPEGGVYRRAVRDKFGTVTHFKYEPRVKPPRERLESGTTLKFSHLPLGSYNTDHEARIVRQIAAFYYGKEEGHVQLQDGLPFSIPSMSEQEESLSGMEKANWVSRKTKAVYADLLKEKASKSVQLLNPALRTNSQVGGAIADACIHSARIEACAALGTYSIELASPPHADPSLAAVQFDVSAGLASFDAMIAELWANDPAPQARGLDSQMHTGGVADIVAHCGGCLPQVDGAAAQDLGHLEPQLPSHPMHLRDGQVNHLQQLVTRQKKELQDAALRIVELKHQLMEVEVQKSNFEQQLMKSEVEKSELQREVTYLRSKLQRVANSQVATWPGFITGVDIQ